MFKSYFTPHMLRSNSYRLTVDFIGITGQGDMEALLSCAGDKVIKGNKKFTANFSVQLSRLKADKTVFLPRCIDLDFNGNLNYLNFCRQSQNFEKKTVLDLGLCRHDPPLMKKNGSFGLVKKSTIRVGDTRIDRYGCKDNHTYFQSREGKFRNIVEFECKNYTWAKQNVLTSRSETFNRVYTSNTFYFYSYSLRLQLSECIYSGCDDLPEPPRDSNMLLVGNKSPPSHVKPGGKLKFRCRSGFELRGVETEFFEIECLANGAFNTTSVCWHGCHNGQSVIRS